MRISDWSSDVCSSDLPRGDRRDRVDGADALARSPDIAPGLGLARIAAAEIHRLEVALGEIVGIEPRGGDRVAQVIAVPPGEEELGRASCRESVCKCV